MNSTVSTSTDEYKNIMREKDLDSKTNEYLVQVKIKLLEKVTEVKK